MQRSQHGAETLGVLQTGGAQQSQFYFAYYICIYGWDKRSLKRVIINNGFPFSCRPPAHTVNRVASTVCVWLDILSLFKTSQHSLCLHETIDFKFNAIILLVASGGWIIVPFYLICMNSHQILNAMRNKDVSFLSKRQMTQRNLLINKLDGELTHWMTDSRLLISFFFRFDWMRPPLF